MDRSDFEDFVSRERRDQVTAFINENYDNTLNNTFGLRADLAAQWTGEFSYTYSRNEVCGVCFIDNYINGFNDPVTPVQALVDAGELNPFSTAPFTEEQLDAMLASNFQTSQKALHNALLKFDGPLFDLPGGTVRAALGSEYIETIQWLQNGAARGASTQVIKDVDTRDTRDQWSAFGELYVPLIGAGMNVPLVDELIVNAALRYDRFSDFGDTTNPRVGVSWVLNDELAMRSSWGTSFRAPGLPDLNPDVFSVVVQFPFLTVAPGIEGFEGLAPFADSIFRLGGNEDLQPEKGKTWSLGLDYTPAWLDGMRFGFTWYKIKFSDRLQGGLPFGQFLTSQANADLFAPFVHRINNPDTCVNGDPSTWDPVLVPFATNFAFGGVNTPCTVQVVADARNTNASKTKQDGLDFSLNYSVSTTLGRFGLGASFSKILNNKQQLLAGGPVDSTLDRIGDPVSLRGRANVNYSRGIFSTTVFMNHVGSYLNDLPISLPVTNDQGQTVMQELPASKVPAWTTFDWTLSLDFPDETNWGMLRNTRFSVNIINIADDDPPVVLSSNNTSSTIDLVAHNAFGRGVQLQLNKRF